MAWAFKLSFLETLGPFQSAVSDEVSLTHPNTEYGSTALPSAPRNSSNKLKIRVRFLLLMMQLHPVEGSGRRYFGHPLLPSDSVSPRSFQCSQTTVMAKKPVPCCHHDVRCWENFKATMEPCSDRADLGCLVHRGARLKSLSLLGRYNSCNHEAQCSSPAMQRSSNLPSPSLRYKA